LVDTEFLLMGEAAKELLKETAVAILCGGRGTRMGSADRHKVCIPIAGAPAINRTVKMFNELGARKIVLVVGALAENVISTVGGEFPEVLHVYQSEQQGTGHAAQLAASALKNLGHSGPMLITMGDKVIQPEVIVDLASHFTRSGADLAFVVMPKNRAGKLGGAGRVVTDGRGRVLGNVELRDIQLGRILRSLAGAAASRPRAAMTRENVIRIGLEHIDDEDKIIKALGPLGDRLKKSGRISGRRMLELLGARPGEIQLAGRSFTPDQIENSSKTINLSVYLGSSRFWYRFLPRLNNDNAQREYYLTDVLNLSAAEIDGNWKLVQHTISDPAEVMGFNSPDELLLIEDTLRRRALVPQTRRPRKVPVEHVKLPGRSYKPAGTWLGLFENWPPGLRKRLAEIYGSDEDLLRDRRKLFVKALKLFIKRFGAGRKAIVVRAPGMINLLGRHIDHRGGAVNVMAIDRDVVFVAGGRTDDVVTVCNTDGRRFPDQEFSLAELLGGIDWQDWLTYINSEHVRALLARTAGDWSNHIKASLLRLQQNFRNVRILGFDAAVAGDIPMGAGLSSSSALVVASAEVAVAFNSLDVTPAELVDLCGEGEWFAGSRVGAANHTAIRMGRRGQIAHVRFFPFQIGQTYDFPDDCKVMIAHSGIDVRNTAGAKEKLDRKLASYDLGFMLIKDRLPQYDHLLEHLRDINPRRLNCRISEIYRMLRSVPESVDADSLAEMVSDRHREQLDRILRSGRRQDRYELRGVLLYGIAECERSVLAPELFTRAALAEVGKLMLISHDGDRVAGFDKTPAGKWRRIKFRYDGSDAALARLCDDLASEDPRRVLDAQLYMQSGSYGCSTCQIDNMIDIVKSMSGVYGGQMGGAGLGGCIMTLIRPDAVEPVCRALRRQYYHPAKLEPFIHICHPVAGSGLLAV